MKLIIDTDEKTISLQNKRLYNSYSYEDIADAYFNIVNNRLDYNIAYD